MPPAWRGLRQSHAELGQEIVDLVGGQILTGASASPTKRHRFDGADGHDDAPSASVHRCRRSASQEAAGRSHGSLAGVEASRSYPDRKELVDQHWHRRSPICSGSGGSGSLAEHDAPHEQRPAIPLPDHRDAPVGIDQAFHPSKC
jgi:hypothetical protein